MKWLKSSYNFNSSRNEFIEPVNVIGVDYYLKHKPHDKNQHAFYTIQSDDKLSQNDKKHEAKDSRNGQTGWRKFGGIFFSLLSCATMSFMAMVVKLLNHYHPFTLTFWRYMGTTTPSAFIIVWYIFWKKEPILKPLWPLFGKDEGCKDRKANVNGLMVRGIFGVAVTIFRFSALKYLSLADVSVITQSTPAIVFILAFFFLKEKCSIVAIISAFLAICGVAILSRPPLITGAASFDHPTLIGLVLALGALFCASITIVITRKLRSINFAVLLFGFGIVGVTVSGILSFSYGVFEMPWNLTDALLTLLLSCLAFIGQIFSVLAVKYEESGVISVVKISYVLFAFIWQILLLHMYPDLISIIGASTILAGLLLTAVRKWINTLPVDNPLKQRFSFFLK